jgi:hypothetical protein
LEPASHWQPVTSTALLPPHLYREHIDFNGRTGYVRTAIEAEVLIAPTVSIGAQETSCF